MQGWLTGTAFDIARMAQTLSIPRAKVSASVDVVEATIDSVANLIEQGGSDTKTQIAGFLYQNKNMQTWKMASLILANARSYSKVAYQVSAELKILRS